MPNTTFDPLTLSPSNPPGAPEFESLHGPESPTPLGKDYLLVQRHTRITEDWRQLLQGIPGLELLAVQAPECFLVRVPDGTSSALDLLSEEPRSSITFSPAYKPSWALEPFLRGEAPVDLLQPDGSVVLVGVLHRGEAPGLVAPGLLSRIQAAAPACAGAVIAGTIEPPQRTANGESRAVVVRVSTTCAAAAILEIARTEAVGFVEPRGPLGSLLDDANWFNQTQTPPGAAPPDGSSWRYDTTAKLFRHGVTGRGEIVTSLDWGAASGECHLRYGPNDRDRTEPAAMNSIEPPAAFGPGDTDWHPENKIVAYYMELFGTPAIEPLYDGGGHGTATASCAVGDDFFVAAAHAGVSLDDPRNDEESAARSQLYAIDIDHHQLIDGVAPGAQLIVQDSGPVSSSGQEIWSWTQGLSELITQAYDTPPGSRLYGSQVLFTGTFDYLVDSRQADAEAWARRDLVIAKSAGNSGPAPLTLDGFAHAKSVLAVGGTVAASNGPAGVADSLFYDLAIPVSASSHGPGFPDRVKPDVVAVGGLTMPSLDGAAADADSCGGTHFESGTSYAGPIVAGLAANVRQYFVDGYYPSGSPDPLMSFNPTNALVRAVLVNSTRNLTGDYTADDASGPLGSRQADRPSHGQGWGAIVADDTLYFAGDPTSAGERPVLIVLNDVPNGLKDTARINDNREMILDSFLPTINGAAGPDVVHEFDIYVQKGADLHVTLAWSDAPGQCSSQAPGECPGGCPENLGVHPLVNDLDLEIVAPNGTVWRTRAGADGAVPSSATADPQRLWRDGYSAPRPVSGDVLCPPGCPTCPLGSYEALHEQSDPPVCDFKGRDSSNTVENIFILASDLVEGWYEVRVIGFRVLGNCWTNVEALPNFIDPINDADPEPAGFDLISDQEQGYAVVVSGDVATNSGMLSFSSAVVNCGDLATIRLLDQDALGSGIAVRVETAAGDCDEFLLAGAGGEFQATFPVFDVDDGVAPSCAASGPGDGIVVAGDDSMITATYMDGTRACRATARVTCRDLQFDSVIVLDGCDGSVVNDALNPDEAVILSIAIRNATARSIEALRGELISFHDDVEVLGNPALTSLSGPAGNSQLVDVPVVMHAGGSCDPGETRRFRLELRGEHGFRDRLYFEVPVDCTPGLTLGAYLPGEVAPAIIPGGLDAMLVRRDPLANTNVELSWPNEATATRYDAWRGTIASLHGGVFDHFIPAAGPCDVPEAAVGPRTTLVLAGDAMPGVADQYYLVGGEATCPVGGRVVKGTVGFGNRDRDRSTSLPEERRPAGAVFEPSCAP